VRKIGKKVRKQASKLGLSQLPKTILYAQPKKKRRTYKRIVSDVEDGIRDYVQLLDHSFAQDRSGNERNSVSYYIAPNANLYVEVVNITKGFAGINPANRVLQISIFTDEYEQVHRIANIIDQIWDNGILANINWEKVEKVYKVKRDECITAWNVLLYG